MIELAWSWLRFQPHSELSKWFEQRFGHGGARMRRIGIAALSEGPHLIPLLSEPDAYLRLAAVYCLAEMARGPGWNPDLNGVTAGDTNPATAALVPALRRALADESEIQMAAGLGLFRCGATADGALPDALRVLNSPDGAGREAALRVLAGLGPAAAAATDDLLTLYRDAEGKESLVTRVLATLGTAAADTVVPVLEKYRTPENPFLADTCYVLFCLHGGNQELENLAALIGAPDLPRGYAEWQDSVRFLSALGGRARPLAAQIRARLPSLDSERNLQSRLERALTGRIEAGSMGSSLLLAVNADVYRTVPDGRQPAGKTHIVAPRQTAFGNASANPIYCKAAPLIWRRPG